MKRAILYIFTIATILWYSDLSAQNNAVRLERESTHKEGNMLIMDVSLNVDSLAISKNEMVTLIPVLESTDRQNSHSFDSIVITGKRKEKMIARNERFNNNMFEETPKAIIRHEPPQTIPMRLELPYQEWQHSANLYVAADTRGCACKQLDSSRYLLTGPILPALFTPTFELEYITPPTEEVKRRSETYSAYLNYEVGKHKLLPNFKNNAEEPRKVNEIITEIRNDRNLTVSEFKITGYASPEGNEQSNMTLSKNRAQSFVTYLKDRYGIDPSMLKTEWKGEDWDGLRKVVVSSNISHKNEVLNLIDSESNIAQRKNKLKQINGGRTYSLLLNDYYPQLRRNDYTIAYVARNFDVNEAKEVIKTKPQHLSLNEMFLVANTYPKNSNEFKEAFDIAARVYPDNPIQYSGFRN
ncbi:MAG: DUF3868 domain-containing protein [Prevotellaceae bacterium]|jgi:hypothetical protein|nr:DUF3868 domain-containing protein [Prevotellaceae bacterium]